MLDLEKAVEALPMNKELDFDTAARMLCRAMRVPTSDRAAAVGILLSFQVAGLVDRGPGKRYQTVKRVSPPAYVSPTPTVRRGPTMSAVVDEWGNTKDFPVGPVADAEIARVKRVRMSAERARLVSILGTDA